LETIPGLLKGLKFCLCTLYLFRTSSANIFYQPPPSLPRHRERWKRRKRHWKQVERVSPGVLHGHVRNFLSNPHRIHSGQKDKGKEEGGLHGLLSASYHPSPPPFTFPPPRTAHLSHRLRPRYHGWLVEGDPPPTHSPTGLWPDLGNLAQSRGRPPFRSL
jgi:hypothetical protein